MLPLEQVTDVQEKSPKRFFKVNQLNDLPGKEWIKFTKSWFKLGSQPRDRKICHPASFPESLALEFISFFTKERQWVLDPFLGTGSSLLAARIMKRNGIGIELYPKYLEIANQRLNEIVDPNSHMVLRCADARKLTEVFAEEGLPEVDFCITSPPYWNQLSRNHRRQKVRESRGFDTIYGAKPDDLGTIESYDSFIAEQESVFDGVFELTKIGGYLVVITNNVYRDGRVWPLAFDTFRTLSRKWTPKDERIWCQDDKALFPFGIFDTYVGNRTHHYCLIFKKELRT